MAQPTGGDAPVASRPPTAAAPPISARLHPVSSAMRGTKDGESEAAGRVPDEHAAACRSQNDPPVEERSPLGYVGNQEVHGGKNLIGDLPQGGDGIIAKPAPRF